MIRGMIGFSQDNKRRNSIMSLRMMAVKRLVLDFNPRCLGELSLITALVRDQGLTLPFSVVRRDGKFLIKDRELYFLAARKLGLKRVPVVWIEDERLFERQLI